MTQHPLPSPDPDAAPAVEDALLRAALGRFATGVTIITCVEATADETTDGKGALSMPDEGDAADVAATGVRGWVGLTANSFNSLSLDPPLVLWSLREASPALHTFTRSARFAVNVLTESQIDLSRRFASRSVGKFAHGVWTLGEHGAPVLAGCAAVFECETVSIQHAGDHRLFIGRVLGCTETARSPLVYRAGHYHVLGERL